ncbi:hypothetical protein KSP39_PZI011643 [Platanthera zijinensis]|uniref:Uncharacterized protein n=1 Tax=Platanthera zijinensis TaxID=2320716 RepID=A0AAP0BI80_9ASPA
MHIISAFYNSVSNAGYGCKKPKYKVSKSIEQAKFQVKHRANMKCPQSAPSNSAKNAISRMSAMNSVPEKMAMAKLKRHPITSLRETLIQRKERAPTLVNEKAQTTPMNNCSRTKYLKEPTIVVYSE